MTTNNKIKICKTFDKHDADHAFDHDVDQDHDYKRQNWDLQDF